jgi:hypothetical protein
MISTLMLWSWRGGCAPSMYESLIPTAVAATEGCCAFKDAIALMHFLKMEFHYFLRPNVGESN